jgi:hypothetical protein
MTITEFLLARIAEDEETARTRGDGPVHFPGCSLHDNSTEPFRCDCAGPDRALAECEAKRRIVVRDGWAAMHPCTRPGHTACTLLWEEHHDATLAMETLQIVTTPYADHPDYRDEWRP